ncbi:MAG TPA: universal stress protein [Micromonosporaceae bacterium]|nr:universal stress protein [Micromonosporaceae bacterium]
MTIITREPTTTLERHGRPRTGDTRLVAVAIGGRGAALAVNWALDEVAGADGRLLLAHACPPGSPIAACGSTQDAGWVELLNPRLARALAVGHDRLGRDRITLRTLSGRPERVLAFLAAGADLLVVGPPGLQFPGGYGSTTHHLAAHAPCPVVVVRPTAVGGTAPARGDVVVGVDGSPAGAAALEFAFGWARTHRCGLAAVRVSRRRLDDYWLDRPALSTHASLAPAEIDTLLREIGPWTRVYPEVPVRYAVYGGRPSAGLLRAAEGARLLVVGDRHRGPAVRAILGTATHDVLDRARGPVAVVRAT